MTDIKLVENIDTKLIRYHFDEETKRWYYSPLDFITLFVKTGDSSIYYSVHRKRVPDLIRYEKRFKLIGLSGREKVTVTLPAEAIFEMLRSIPERKSGGIAKVMKSITFEQFKTFPLNDLL